MKNGSNSIQRQFESLRAHGTRYVKLKGVVREYGRHQEAYLDSSCPPNIHRSKHISHNIIGCANVCTVGISEGEYGLGDEVGNGENRDLDIKV